MFDNITSLQEHMQGVVSLSIVLLLVALLATMAIVSNPVFAGSRLFKNKAECMEYVTEDSYVVRNHALQKAKVKN